MTTMAHEIDAASGLPIGLKIPDPSPGAFPTPTVLDGRFCRLEPLSVERHGAELFAASNTPDAAARFLYLFEEPYPSRAACDAWLASSIAKPDLVWSAVIDKRSGRCEGRQALMRIDPAVRSAEVGSILWGPAITRTAITTEAIYLTARHVFEDLKYRRFEWKCHALNAPSRKAALRFGFSYEGYFRNATIIKGRARDTTWYAMTQEDWPKLAAGYRAWLDPANMGDDGRQKAPLSAFVPRGREDVLT
jgi:RimJ/RimL family protein N-acetyltransferase